MIHLKQNAVNQIPVFKDTLSIDLFVYQNLEVEINNKIVVPTLIDEYVGWIQLMIDVTDDVQNEDLNNGFIYLIDNQYVIKFIYNSNVLFEEVCYVGDFKNEKNGAY